MTMTTFRVYFCLFYTLIFVYSCAIIRTMEKEANVNAIGLQDRCAKCTKRKRLQYQQDQDRGTSQPIHLAEVQEQARSVVGEPRNPLQTVGVSACRPY